MSTLAPPAADLALIRPAGAEVEAGGLIARGPQRLCPPAADGAAGLPLPMDGLEVRAACDGRVVAGPGGIGVDGRTVVAGNLVRSRGPRVVRVRGTLVVQGGIGAGMRVEATGDVLVAGPVERAEIVAGGAILLEGRAATADLRAGVLAALHHHLRGRLRLVPAALGRAVHTAERLLASARSRGLDLAPARALCLATAATWPALTERLAELVRILARAHQDLPHAAPDLEREARALLAALDGGEGGGCLDLARSVARRLAARAGERAHRLDGVRAREVVGCQVQTPGVIRLTGRGALESDLRAGGDVSVPAGVVAGGEVVTAGQLSARGLGRGATLTEVRLVVGHAGPPGLERDRVVAGAVHGPCEVRGPLDLVRLPERDGEVRLYLASGVPLLRS